MDGSFGGPAWDFIWNISEPVADKEYSISFRSMFKPFISQQDVLEEYDSNVTD